MHLLLVEIYASACLSKDIVNSIYDLRGYYGTKMIVKIIHFSRICADCSVCKEKSIGEIYKSAIEIHSPGQDPPL